jgi:hypothetical protein
MSYVRERSRAYISELEFRRIWLVVLFPRAQLLFTILNCKKLKQIQKMLKGNKGTPLMNNMTNGERLFQVKQ